MTFSLLAVAEVMIASLAGSGDIGSTVFFAGTAGVVGGLVGRAMWWLLVESSNRWTLPVRGAIAGGFTGWLSIPLIATVWFVPEQFSAVANGVEIGTISTSLLEFGARSAVLGILGTVAVGWMTIPTAALAGYAIGRERTGDDTSE